MIWTVMPLKLRPTVVAVTRSRTACMPSRLTAPVTVSTLFGESVEGTDDDLEHTGGNGGSI